MPSAPSSRCTEPRCGRFATKNSKCDEHQRNGWEEYRRRNKPNDTRNRLGISTTRWEELKNAAMAEHNGRCHWCGDFGADQVDHILAVSLGGAKTALENLAPIHAEPCHREKTAQEMSELRKRKNGTGSPIFFPTHKGTRAQPPEPARSAQKITDNPGIRSI